MKRTRDDSFDPVYPYFYTQSSITNGALVVTGVRTGNNNNTDSNPGGLPSETVVQAPLALVNGHLGLNYGSGLQLYASALQVAAGNGLAIDASGNLCVKAAAPLNADNAALQLNAGNGLQVAEDALSVKAGAGLTFADGALQILPGAGLYLNAGALTVRTTGVIQADAASGLDVSVGDGLAKTNNLLQVNAGPGLQVSTNGLQVQANTGLSVLANGVSVNVGPGLRATNENALAVRAEGALYTTEAGALQVNPGDGLQVVNNALTLKIGTGLTITNGALTVIASGGSGGGGSGSGGGESGGGGSISPTINAQAPLAFANGTLSLTYSGDFIVQNNTLTLQVTFNAPLSKTGNTVSLKTGPTLKVANGTLDTSLQASAPISLNSTNTLALSLGNGLTTSGEKLTISCQNPLTVSSSGLSLRVGSGLTVENGILVAKYGQSFSAVRPLSLVGTQLFLDINAPFTVSGNKLSLNAARPLTMHGQNLTVQVSAPLTVTNNGIQLSYSPFFNTISNQLAPSKYCCMVSGVIPYPVINFGNNTKASFLLVLERVGTMVHGMLRLLDCFVPFTLNKYLILHMSPEGDLVLPNSSYQNSDTLYYTQQLVAYGGLNPSPLWKQALVPGPVGPSESYLPSRPTSPIGFLINDTGSKYLPRSLTFALNIQREMLLHNMEPFFFSYMPLY